ncbi:hypothetical protein NMG60_11019050 [Bertholletia excelsa]
MSTNQTAERNWGQMITCDRVNQMVKWVGSSLTSAFFASLECCSCINLNASHEDIIEDDEEAKDCPFMLTVPNPLSLDDSATHCNHSSDKLVPPTETGEQLNST